jgi:hypothetical protein
MTKSKRDGDDIPPEINPEDIEPEPTVEPATGSYQGAPFDPEWRSALDDPQHPLHHLRDA